MASLVYFLIKGEMRMKSSELWEKFITKYPAKAHCPHDAWAFGAQPTKLAQLVCQGKKTATTSGYLFYELDNEALPQVGEYNIILDENEQAVCITQTTKVYQTTFAKVDARHALLEGEGDLSLAYWRKVHQDFFTQELAELGEEFSPEFEVICEEFTVVYVA